MSFQFLPGDVLLYGASKLGIRTTRTATYLGISKAGGHLILDSAMFGGAKIREFADPASRPGFTLTKIARIANERLPERWHEVASRYNGRGFGYLTSLHLLLQRVPGLRSIPMKSSKGVTSAEVCQLVAAEVTYLKFEKDAKLAEPSDFLMAPWVVSGLVMDVTA